jgi:hypothetical protein
MNPLFLIRKDGTDLIKNNNMKQGFINMLIFLAVTVGPLVFWKSDFGYDLLDKGYGWVAYASAPLVGLVFALVAAEGKINKIFWGVFGLITVILLGIGLGVNLEA